MTKKTNYKNLARHQAKLKAAQKHHHRRRRISVWSIVVVGFIAMLVLFMVFFPSLGGDEEQEASAITCEDLGEAPWSEPFPMCIDEAGRYVATMKTDKGAIRIRLLTDRAPATVNNFAALAQAGYFDDTIFHRVANSIDVIQGGDAACELGASSCGSGDPGFAIDDELTGDEAYTPGTVAMANAGPDSGGSQFFIVTGPNGAALTPDYTVFGEVISGMDVAQEIQQTPVKGETPTKEVTIRSVEVTPPLGEPVDPSSPVPGGPLT